MTFEKISLNWNSILDKSNGHLGIMTGNRKRSRDEESCEFMPLSKRINNLHINGNLSTMSSSLEQQTSQGNATMPITETPQHNTNTNIDQTPTYDPGLSCSQSPYYLHNKLLFELHLERIQRSGQQFPF